MRTSIDELRLFGFGRFSELTLGLGRGLNLLVGPNEAGKSTLLAFVRAVLYGFERRGADARLEPRSGGAFGGELTLCAGNRRLIVSRLGSRRRVEGELSVREAETGAPLPESALSAALGGTNRQLFCEVFSLTLDQLRDFESLAGESEVADALFAAGAQGAQRVPEALAQLDALAAGIWSERAQKRPLNQELSRLEEARLALAASAARPEAWFEAVRERERLEGLAPPLRDEAQALRAQLARCAQLLRAAPAVREALALPVQPLAPAIDPAVLTRVELLEPRRAELVRLELSAATARRVLEDRVAALRLATAGRSGLEDTAAALTRWKGLAPVTRGLAARELALLERQQAVALRCKRLLGRVPPAGWLAEVDAGASRVAELQAFRERELELTAERARAEEAVQIARGEHERLGGSLALLERPPPVASVLELEAQAGCAQQVIELRRSLDACGAREQVLTEGLSASELGEGLEPRALLTPGLAAAGLLGLWVVACLTLLAAPPWAVPGLLAGAVGGSVLGATLYRRARAHGRARLEAHRRLAGERARLREGWRAELDTLGQERARLERAFAGAQRGARVSGADEARALVGQLAGWKREAEDFERCARERVALERARAALELRRDQAGLRVASAGAQLDSIQGEVDARTTSLGFPAGLRAQQAIDLLTEAARLQDEALALARDEGACRAERQLVEDASGRLGASAQRLGVAADGPPDRLAERLERALADDARERAELRDQALRLEQARATLEQVGGERQGLEQALRAEFDAAGAVDLAALKARVLESQRAQAQAERRAQLEAQVRLLCAAGVDAVATQLEGAGPLEDRLAGLQAELDAVDGRLRENAQSLGEIKQRLSSLEGEHESASLRAEAEACSARLTRLATGCATASLASALLQRARQRFEAQHQPRVARRAGDFFERLTDRRYTALEVDPGARTLRVRDRQGGSWSVGQLSRGTRELLLLAFRLAVIEDFGHTRARLPVILDDVLVNVDPDRAGRLVELLAELAERHQVIALTCHPTVRGLFQAAGARITAVQQRTQLSLLAD